MDHNMIRWNPFSELTRTRDERSIFPNIPMFAYTEPDFYRIKGPSVDVHETENEIVVSAEIPGVDPDEIDVTVNETSVVLSGEIRQGSEQDKEGYRVMERRYGTFHRTIRLPVEVKPDEAWADYKNGILEIRLNKSDSARDRSKKLKINKSH
jgi:HSP20 family protein